MTDKTVLVRMTGKVQGVWYRGWTVEEAMRLDLKGWVRNRLDGSVEALFSGPESIVDQMIALCRQGPPEARVVDVNVEAVPSDFHQKPTA